MRTPPTGWISSPQRLPPLLDPFPSLSARHGRASLACGTTDELRPTEPAGRSADAIALPFEDSCLSGIGHLDPFKSQIRFSPQLILLLMLPRIVAASDSRLTPRITAIDRAWTP